VIRGILSKNAQSGFCQDPSGNFNPFTDKRKKCNKYRHFFAYPLDSRIGEIPVVLRRSRNILIFALFLGGACRANRTLEGVVSMPMTAKKKPAGKKPAKRMTVRKAAAKKPARKTAAKKKPARKAARKVAKKATRKPARKAAKKPAKRRAAKKSAAPAAAAS
jgi:hypothetical protein